MGRTKGGRSTVGQGPLRAVGVLVALAVSGIGFGCRPARPVETITAEPIRPEDRLGVDDVFEVRVFEEANLSGTYRVSADGSVDYPLVGRIKVAGLLSGEVQAEIATKLKEGEFLKNPQVSVMVREWNSRKVTVMGQVQKPGPVAYYPRMTIVEAIAAAGGFTPIADKNRVSLRREGGGATRSQSYRVADISEGRGPNIFLVPGDILVVDERMF